MAITINCDIGEGYSLYTFGNDERIMPFISIANVACGFHASDPSVMHATVRLALAHGVKVGAHPSLPDRQGFGRREMQMEREELRDLLIYQVGALKGFLEAAGAPLNHIKPHGALFGMTSKYEHCAEAAADAAEVFGVPLIGQAGTMHDTVYSRRGLPWWPEFYADLEYDRDCNLIITREHEPYDPAAAAKRTLRAIEEGTVTSMDGVDVPIRCRDGVHPFRHTRDRCGRAGAAGGAGAPYGVIGCPPPAIAMRRMAAPATTEATAWRPRTRRLASVTPPRSPASRSCASTHSRHAVGADRTSRPTTAAPSSTSPPRQRRQASAMAIPP